MMTVAVMAHLSKSNVSKLTNLKFLSEKIEFPPSNSRNCASAFCLQFDLAYQFERTFLFRAGHRVDLESLCVIGDGRTVDRFVQRLKNKR